MIQDLNNLKVQSAEKQSEINRLKEQLKELISKQTDQNRSESVASQKTIDSLKAEIENLIDQLAQEKEDSAITQEKQDETIKQLRQELEQQRSITEKIMQKLGMKSSIN